MEMFQAPAVGDEFARQPIKQRGMCRPFALQPEIARRRNEATAKMILPDTVDDDASSEWVLRVNQQMGERGAASGSRGNRCTNVGRLTVKNRQKAGRDFLFRLFEGTLEQ